MWNLGVGMYELMAIFFIAVFVIGMSATIVLTLYILVKRLDHIVSRLEKLESEKEEDSVPPVMK